MVRALLSAANLAAAGVLLAIPIGKLMKLIDAEIDSAAIFGWFVYFTPMFASAVALWVGRFPNAAFVHGCIIVALPGSFLMAALSIYMFAVAPPQFELFTAIAAGLLTLNVVALWRPFVKLLEESGGE